MTTTPENKIVTVTYQSIILNQLKMLMAAHSYNDAETTWQVANATFYALPPEVQKDAEPIFKDIITGLTELHKNCKTIDNNTTRRLLQRERKIFLINNNTKLIKAIHDSMAKNGWYVQDHTVRPADGKGIQRI